MKLTRVNCGAAIDVVWRFDELRILLVNSIKAFEIRVDLGTWSTIMGSDMTRRAENGIHPLQRHYLLYSYLLHLDEQNLNPE